MHGKEGLRDDTPVAAVMLLCDVEVQRLVDVRHVGRRLHALAVHVHLYQEQKQFKASCERLCHGANMVPPIGVSVDQSPNATLYQMQMRGRQVALSSSRPKLCLPKPQARNVCQARFQRDLLAAGCTT